MTLYSEFQEKIATHTQTHRLTHTLWLLDAEHLRILQQAEITESHQNVSIFFHFSIYFFLSLIHL